MGFQTGYWARPGTRYISKVHIVLGGKPYCGATFADDKMFQWCSDRVVDDYINCEKCKKKYEKHLKKVEAQKLKEKTDLEVMTLYPTGLECVCNECNDHHYVAVDGVIPKVFECPTCHTKFATLLWQLSLV